MRQCAQQQQVSPSTVVAAYDQLLALGLVEARKNRGFFVRELNPGYSPKNRSNMTVDGVFIAKTASEIIADTTKITKPINAAMLIRGMFVLAVANHSPAWARFRPIG